MKLRPETIAILDKLVTYDYVCLWVNSVPKIAFSKGDSQMLINLYINKHVPENQDWYVDGAWDSDFDEEKIRT